MTRALAPVDPEVLDEERRGDHARAVVHPPLRAKLPHARVDERVAGHPLLPGREPVGVVEPAVAPRAHVVDLGLAGARRGSARRSRASRAGARTRRRRAPARARRGHAARRSRSAGRARAARSRRRRARRGRPCRSRRGAPAATPPPCATPALSPPGIVARVDSTQSSGAGRLDAVGQPDRPRRRHGRPPRHLRPGTVVRREDLVVVVARRGDLSGGDDEVAVDEAKVELGREPPLRARPRTG